ncbi:MAG: hypothetical protein ABIJ43_02895 [Candidatus Beckwithbacteria bacterium]|nr:DUF916 domain-containing protein [Patescibacteria group bacterium]
MKKFLPITKTFQNTPGVKEVHTPGVKFLLLFLAIFSLSLAAPVRAQESISITAIPPRLELTALPGATLQETIKIKNNSDTELAFTVQSSDFIVNDDQGTPIAVSEIVSGRWSLSSWLTASPKKILLAPNQTQSIDLIITMPDDALAGGRYAMITYQPITEGQMQAGTGSAIQQKVGTLIYLNVIGDVTKAAYLKEFKVDKPFKQYGPINLFAQIENLGDIHLRPTGSIIITNLFNKTVADLKLDEKNIFPFASRTYEFEVPGKWRFGKYQAELTALAGDSEVSINGLIYFWILPYKELSAIALAILVVIILIIILKKKKSKPTPPPQNIIAETPETTPPTT